MPFKEKVKDWIKGGKDFYQGVAVYAQAPNTNRRLMRAFSEKGPTLYNLGKIDYEIMKQVPKDFLLIEEEEIGGDVEPKKVERSKPHGFDNYPNAVKQLYSKRSKLYRERDFNHSQLALFKTDEERFEACKLIISLQVDIDQVWKQLDDYHDKGQLPNDINDIPVGDILKLTKRKLSILTYISKYKKQIKDDPANRNIDKWRFKLEAFKNELKDINGKIASC